MLLLYHKYSNFQACFKGLSENQDNDLPESKDPMKLFLFLSLCPELYMYLP